MSGDSAESQPSSADRVRIFGIRHHGPGSARALRLALTAWEPDAVLVEGPPEADGVLRWLAHPELEPPVALLIYRPDKPQQSAFYPFAVFSPEYQALRYAVTRGVHVRFCDLPQAHRLAMQVNPLPPAQAPMQIMAQAAGYPNYEVWWNAQIEQRRDVTALFDSVMLLMQALREADGSHNFDQATLSPEQLMAARREAKMRHTIRQTLASGYRRVAVVVGAWHAPALHVEGETPGAGQADSALLADLPTVAVEAAWAPWTYSRLSVATGYGAGVHAPGWYHHLWRMGQRDADVTTMNIHWLTRVAALLRERDATASAAHIIETVRLANAVAALRNLPFPGLLELTEATQAVLCAGDAAPLMMIEKRLIIGERMGHVPDGAPLTPLQRDLRREQKKLRLRPEPEQSTLKLDLRTPLHLSRSHLLHRLLLLGIQWGQLLPTRGHQGTYREMWRLQWQPSMTVRVIEMNQWGNTVHAAAAGFALDRAQKAATLTALTKLLDAVILAELPDVIAHIMARIDAEAAASSDIIHMMTALPPLARVLRYGNVRQTDQSVVQHVVDGLLTRIYVGLPSTAATLGDDASAELLTHLMTTHGVVVTLQDDDHRSRWHAVLQTLADQPNVHNLIAGRACRLLLDGRVFSAEAVAQRMSRALSVVAIYGQPIEHIMQAAFWLEGFLRDSGMVMVHDDKLWQLLDEWVRQLDGEQFEMILPLLRRTFATFSDAVRDQMRRRIRPNQQTSTPAAAPTLDVARAAAVRPFVAQILGVDHE